MVCVSMCFMRESVVFLTKVCILEKGRWKNFNKAMDD